MILPRRRVLQLMASAAAGLAPMPGIAWADTLSEPGRCGW